jgi:hypothetical protein
MTIKAKQENAREIKNLKGFEIHTLEIHAYRIKEMIEPFTLYYTLQWINIKINTILNLI